MGHLPHDQTDRYMAQAKCVIIPSKWYEVLPYIYLEALSHGTPVLTPYTSVFSRKLEKNTMYYYRFNDFIDLKKRIGEIHNDDKKNSPQFYKEFKLSYTPELHLKGIMTIYRKLLSR
jgi:glycosyltransferase involved in cell wall biosynthesis